MYVKKKGILTNKEKKKYAGKYLINFEGNLLANNQGIKSAEQNNLRMRLSYCWG
jgi:hypothetical protein